MPVPTLRKTGSRGRKSSPYLKKLENSKVSSQETKIKPTRDLAKSTAKKNNENRKTQTGNIIYYNPKSILRL